jgi:hypothetical protein
VAPGAGPGPASSSLRGTLSWRPGHPVVAQVASGDQIGGGPIHHAGSPSVNAWPARLRRATSCHNLFPTSFRAFRSVPNIAIVRAVLPPPHAPTQVAPSIRSKLALKSRSAPTLSLWLAVRRSALFGYPDQLRYLTPHRISGQIGNRSQTPRDTATTSAGFQVVSRPSSEVQQVKRANTASMAHITEHRHRWRAGRNLLGRNRGSEIRRSD